MEAATTGRHAIRCTLCHEAANVPDPWMEFCAPCANSVFKAGKCRLCGAKVVIRDPRPGEQADRIFEHEEGPKVAAWERAVSASRRYDDPGNFVPDLPWCTGNPQKVKGAQE